MNNNAHLQSATAEHKIYHINNNLADFISIKTNVSNSNQILLVDTEASLCLIKISSISARIKYDKTDIIKLQV